MIIFPAIDIKDGKVVRLLQGRFDDVTKYSDNPVTVAQTWADKGAQWLHIVDLDGAKDEKISNLSVISEIAHNVNIPIEMGGGIRTKEDIINLLNAGVSRVILGTKVVEDCEFLKEILSIWPEQIAVSLDCKNGMVAKKGWTSVTDLKAVDFAKELEQLGLKYLVYTDIKRDGMLTGPDIEGLKSILEAVNIPIIASGGISSIEDIKKLLELKNSGLLGAITGKALYEGTLDLESALKLCSQSE